MEQEGDRDISCNCSVWNNRQRIVTGNERLGNKRTCRDHPEKSIYKIRQNTDISPGDLKRHTVPQPPERNHHLTPA